MQPWLQDADVTLYHGDVLAVLPELPAESVDCVVTSPPYWGLRDYGQEGQLGLEPTPEQYVERMVSVFREVRRVLAPHGTVWLNLGDSYAQTEQRHRHDKGPAEWGTRGGEKVGGASTAVSGLKPKDLCGIPWRVAFALQADGWYLRSDIIWSKPNPMPESVTDRPTKAHEYVFLLSKQPRYFFDQEAVREPATYFGPNGSAATMDGKNNSRAGEMKSRAGSKSPVRKRNSGGRTDGYTVVAGTAPAPPQGRNIRSVWEIATQPYPEAHFATFPEELARRCIAAGTSEKGKCPECGAPWVRAVGKERIPTRPGGNPKGRANDDRRDANIPLRPELRVTTLGWHPSCEAHGFDGDGGELPGTPERLAPVPTVVLDPFVGSGTVCYVARKLGRHSIGIDLSAEYLALAARRLQQQSLFAEV